MPEVFSALPQGLVDQVVTHAGDGDFFLGPVPACTGRIAPRRRARGRQHLLYRLRHRAAGARKRGRDLQLRAVDRAIAWSLKAHGRQARIDIDGAVAAKSSRAVSVALWPGLARQQRLVAVQVEQLVEFRNVVVPAGGFNNPTLAPLIILRVVRRPDAATAPRGELVRDRRPTMPPSASWCARLAPCPHRRSAAP